MHQGDQDRDLYQWTDNSGECFPGINTKYCNRNRNSQFKIIAGSRKGNSCCFGITSTYLFPHKKGYQEHHHKIDHQWDGNPDYIKRDLYNVFPLEGEHHNDRKKQGDQGQGTDSWDEFAMVPFLVLYPDQDEP